MLLSKPDEDFMKTVGVEIEDILDRILAAPDQVEAVVYEFRMLMSSNLALEEENAELKASKKRPRVKARSKPARRVNRIWGKPLDR